MKARIVNVTGDPVQRITLTTTDKFSFRAGQYLTLHTPAGRHPEQPAERSVPMSIASAPQRLPEFELHYRSQPDNDDASAIDDLLSSIEEIEFSGPDGEVTVSASESRPLTIFCGGTGAAQAFGIVETLTHAAPPVNCRWLWCAATAQDLYATDSLQLTQDQTWLDFHTFVDTELGPNNAAMRWLAEHAPELTNDRILLCGGPPFVYQALDVLVAAGVSAGATESDVYAYAPRPAPTPEVTNR